MKNGLNPLCENDVRIERLSHHSDTMNAHTLHRMEKPTDNEPPFLRTESISKLLCHCAKESASPKFQKKTLRHLHKMNSISKSFQEAPKSKDSPAVKGILTLFFCIVYAAGLFIMAAVLSRVSSSFGKPAVVASPKGVQVEMWESESKKHLELRKTRLVHTRWGQ